MATTLYNGSVNGKSNDGTSGSYTFYLEVILNSQNVQANTSNITINHYAKGNNGYYYEQYSSPKSYIKIYDNNTDTTITKKTTTVKAVSATKTKIGTWTGDVTHKADGTLTINVTAQYKSNDSTWYLPAEKSLSSGNLVLTPLHKVPEINSVTITENTASLVSAGITSRTFVSYLSNKTISANVTYYDNANFGHAGLRLGNEWYFGDTNPYTIDFSDKSVSISSPTDNYFYVQDDLGARGNIQWDDVSVISYILPTLIPTSSSIKRNGQTSGKAKMNLKGSFYNGIIGNTTNTIQLDFAYWENGDTESTTYYTIPSNVYTISGNNVTLTNWDVAKNNVLVEDLDERKSYIFKIRITDSMGKQYVMELLCPNGEYIMCQFKDRVDFKKLTLQNNTVPIPQVLYEDTLDTGKNTTVTLSETAANFEYLEIFYYANTRNVYGDNSTKIAKPDGKTTTLRCDAYTSNYHYMTIGNVSISGTSITWNHQTRIRIANNAASTITTGVDTMYITKVIGYKI